MNEDIKVGDEVEFVANYGSFRKGDKGIITGCYFVGVSYIISGYRKNQRGVTFSCYSQRVKKVSPKSQKGIFIKVEKLVYNGVEQVRILDIKALKKEDLPEEYLHGDHIYYYEQDKSLIGGYPNDVRVVVGEYVSKEDFTSLMEFMKRCGCRLEEINKKNRMKKPVPVPEEKKPRVWEGVREYVI